MSDFTVTQHLDLMSIAGKIRSLPTLEKQVLVAMREARQSSWTTDDQEQFKVAIAAIGWVNKDNETVKAAIRAEVKVLQALAFSSNTGVIVDWEQLAVEGREAPPSLGLLRAWHKAVNDEKKVKWIAEKTRVSPTLVQQILDAAEAYNG